MRDNKFGMAPNGGKTVQSVQTTRLYAGFVAVVLAMVGIVAQPKVAQAAPAQITERQAFTLDDAEWETLGQIQQQCHEIACGQRTVATIEIDPSPILGANEWEKDARGLVNDWQEEPQTVDNHMRYAKGRIDYSIRRILSVLEKESPSTVYWLRDPTFYDISIEWTSREQDGRSYLLIARATVNCYVLPCLSSDGKYGLSPQGIQEIQGAIATAQEIADRHAGEPVESRLRSYCDEIYARTSYAYGVSYSSDSRPWSITSVFDGDPATQSICEAYAKAFKLIVELSGARDCECHTVEGRCLSSHGRVPHMWCVVKMPDGKNYWADITNNQEGAAGAGLVLIAPAYGSPEGGYEVPMMGETATYTYDELTMEVYSRDTLTISDAPYATTVRVSSHAKETSTDSATPYREPVVADEKPSTEEAIEEDENTPEQAEEKREWDLPLVDNKSYITDLGIDHNDGDEEITADDWVVPAALTIVAFASVATPVVALIRVGERNKRQVRNYIQMANK